MEQLNLDGTSTPMLSEAEPGIWAPSKPSLPPIDENALGYWVRTPAAGPNTYKLMAGSRWAKIDGKLPRSRESRPIRRPRRRPLWRSANPRRSFTCSIWIRGSVDATAEARLLGPGEKQIFKVERQVIKQQRKNNANHYSPRWI